MWMKRHRSTLIAAAAIAPLLCSAGLAAFRESITAATAALVLVLIVVAAAATGDRLAEIVAALSSGAWFDFFLTKPYGRFTIDDPNDIEVTVLLVLVGIAVTEIALWGRRQQARASRRAGYLDGVLGTSRIIALQETSPIALINHVAHQIVQLLDIDDCQFVEGAGPAPQDTTLDHDGQVTRRGYSINVQRDGLPTDDWIGLVVRQSGVTHGRFLLTAATRVVHPSIEQLKVAVLLADHVDRRPSGDHPIGLTSSARPWEHLWGLPQGVPPRLPGKSMRFLRPPRKQTPLGLTAAL
jgi:K+-sensing histidine kinase KdpD